MKKISFFFANTMYCFVTMFSNLTVNSTCCGRFYQEKLDTQLDTLRKHHDKKEKN